MSNNENQDFQLKEDSAQSVKGRQYQTLLWVLLSIGFLFAILIYFLGSDSSDTKSDPIKEEVVSFSDSTAHVTPQKIWLENAQNQIKKVQEENQKLNQKIDQLSVNGVNKPKESDSSYQALEKQIEVLRKAMEGGASGVPTSNQARIFPAGNSNGNKGEVTQGASVSQEQAGIDTDILQLKDQNDRAAPKRNPDSFVPAGTFVQAVMLGAADAPAGVTSRSDPKPLLFRIVENGTMPNSKKSHLKGCFVTAAVVGDISSERGDIRLERLSCNFQSGDRVETIEQTIDGTVFGMDGKNGVRGTPVWREGALLTRAAIAGTLSGAANAVSQSYTTNSISPLGSTQSVNNGEIAKYSLAQGGSNAMEKLAEYNIKRADQYHPIIQISAGQPVDLVILKGFYLDGGKHSELDQDQHKTPELFTQSNSSSTPGLTLSEKQIQKIESHESQLNRSLE